MPKPRKRTAVMCSEGEPLECHRTLLVGQALDGLGVAVGHIHPDGSLESHREAMDRLLATFGMTPDGDLLTGREDAVAAAVERQGARVGHVRRKRPSR